MLRQCASCHRASGMGSSLRHLAAVKLPRRPASDHRRESPLDHEASGEPMCGSPYCTRGLLCSPHRRRLGAQAPRAHTRMWCHVQVIFLARPRISAGLDRSLAMNHALRSSQITATPLRRKDQGRRDPMCADSAQSCAAGHSCSEPCVCVATLLFWGSEPRDPGVVCPVTFGCHVPRCQAWTEA